MKRIIVFAALLVGALYVVGQDKPREEDKYFMYPRAAVVVEGEGFRSRGECSRNHSINHVEGSTEKQDPIFSDGLEIKNGKLDFFVHWRLVGKTEYGDVYVVAFTRYDKLEWVKPVLFEGKSLTVISNAEVTMRFLPELPKDK